MSGHGTAGAAPSLVWSPSLGSFDFGTVSVGAVSSTHTFTVANPGPGGATLALANAVGADAANFTVTLSGCAIGDVLYENGTCNVIVQFAPGTAGAKTASVQIASSGSPPSPLVVNGTGMGGPTAGLAFSANALAFGEVRVNAQSAPQEIKLTSDGSGTLRVTDLTVTGPYTLQSRTCPAAPFDLPPGSDCTVTVNFDPSSTGSRAGVMSVTSNASGSPMTVTLDGQGQSAPDVSSGGCSLVDGNSPVDPTLWALVVTSVAVLARRHRARRVKPSEAQTERHDA
ncbi:MAG: choice-of-anchor D domain-containing protein [Pseudomonadota bacterium]